MISKLDLPAFPAPVNPLSLVGLTPSQRFNLRYSLPRQHQKERASAARALVADVVYALSALSEPVGKLTTDTLKAEMRGDQ